MERKNEWTKERGRFAHAGPEHARFARPGVPHVLLRSDVDLQRARLSGVIADEIIPRLNFVHHGLRSEKRVAVPSGQDIAEFAALVMRADPRAAYDYFDKMREEGYSIDTLFLDLLEPTARYLDEVWEQDRCDLIDATIGVVHLRMLISEFGSKDDTPVRDSDHRALLVACPGEKQVFGLEIVAQFMRDAGWDVSHRPGLNNKKCGDVAAAEWFAVLGVGLSGDINVGAAASMIATVKRASANSSIAIMVVGPIFEKKPELIIRLGADAAAPDAPTAVVLAKKLLLAFRAKRGETEAVALQTPLGRNCRDATQRTRPADGA